MNIILEKSYEYLGKAASWNFGSVLVEYYFSHKKFPRKLVLDSVFVCICPHQPIQLSAAAQAVT